MATNDFRPFAAAATANVISQQAFLALPARLVGFSAGTAWSPQLNKVWRQSSIISSMVAQFAVDKTGQDYIDDGTIDVLEATFISALQKVIRETTGRVLLTADLDIYVSVTGDDTNDGTSAHPFRTIQKAIDTIYELYDVGDNSVNIRLSPGTHQAFVAYSRVLGRNYFAIKVIGDKNNASNYVISGTTSLGYAVGATNGASLTIEGTKVSSSTGSGIYATNSAFIYVRNVEFGNCQLNHVLADNGGRIEIAPVDSYTNRYPYVISGSAQTHLCAFPGGFIQFPYGNVTVSAAPNFSVAFAYSVALGYINAGGTVFGGAATGKRYIVDNLGYIETIGSGGSFFPGSIAGTVGTYGVYR